MQNKRLVRSLCFIAGSSHLASVVEFINEVCLTNWGE